MVEGNLFINQVVIFILPKKNIFELQNVSKLFYHTDSLVLIDPFVFQKKRKKINKLATNY